MTEQKITDVTATPPASSSGCRLRLERWSATLVDHGCQYVLRHQGGGRGRRRVL